VINVDKSLLVVVLLVFLCERRVIVREHQVDTFFVGSD